jgi:hypothetical protein
VQNGRKTNMNRRQQPAQSQAAEPQDTLEMCKQHLNALSIVAMTLLTVGHGILGSWELTNAKGGR